MSMTWTSIRYAWDKRETSQLAEKLSIPIPRSWFPRADADPLRSMWSTAGADVPSAIRDVRAGRLRSTRLFLYKTR